jgi:diguanylate cyclase (GGDEF)-like protein
MNPPPRRSSTERPPPAETLNAAIGQSERVKVLVEQSADELSSVNNALKEEVAAHDELPGVESALAKSVVVENKVQDASAKLAVVNQVLKSEVAERHELEEQLAAVVDEAETNRIAAVHDPLTGLPNRVLFADRLEQGLAQATRHGWNLAVMFLDLNCFKRVNDEHGHAIGDAVLQEVGRRLQGMTRADDTISRHGGDEFLCLLIETGAEQDLVQIAEKFIREVQLPCDLGESSPEVSLNMSVSIGISVFPKDGATAGELTASADAAMYRAKRDGSGYAFASDLRPSPA